MGSLLVVTGPPGAGKSTVARLLAEASDPSVLVEGDAFFAFLASGALEPWTAESHKQNTVVTRAAAAAAGTFAAGGLTTIYDGVVGPWFLPTFAQSSGLEELDYAILLPPVDTCIERVLTRQDHGFRNEAAARKMHAEFTSADIADRHVLTELPSGPRDVAIAIGAARAAGKLAYTTT